MKFTKNDVLAILKRFEIANDRSNTKQIDQSKVFNPSSTNILVSFRFDKKPYFIFVDDTADDDEKYILEQVRIVDASAEGKLVASPISDIKTLALPFKGKHIYLLDVKATKNRLDVRLAKENPALSRSSWQKQIKAGHINVNGKVVTDTKYEVDYSDDIQVEIMDENDFSDSSLPIIYLDENIIVVDKPAGVLTHSKGEINEEFTVVDFFRKYTTVGLDTNRPGVVHRLDRDTSGVIVGARTPEAFDILKKQFSERKAKKTYLAVVDGVPKLDHANIDIPIGRNPKAPGTFRPDKKGKAASTEYRVIDVNEQQNMSLVELKPRTGRTHQIRVHMKHIGNPVHGDRVYGQPADRLYLHAYRLELTVAPGQRMTFTSPLPREFSKYFDSDSAHDYSE